MVIYNKLYKYLSFFVHPDIRIAGNYSEDGFLSHNSKNNEFMIAFYINYINALLLFDLLRMDIFKD